MLARQIIYHLTHSDSLYCDVYFAFNVFKWEYFPSSPRSLCRHLSMKMDKKGMEGGDGSQDETHSALPQFLFAWK
jgi:hypothetical protein